MENNNYKMSNFLNENKPNLNLSLSDFQRSLENRVIRNETTFRTEICRKLRRTGFCAYGDMCRFAHDESELRVRPLHPKHKTQLCKNFTAMGVCIYGSRCQFIHAERNIKIIQNSSQIKSLLELDTTSFKANNVNDISLPNGDNENNNNTNTSSSNGNRLFNGQISPPIFKEFAHWNFTEEDKITENNHLFTQSCFPMFNNHV
uniref:C3H1-type domain-containing protein n=1 Tax=Meloidogyne floridensis TaxID=298350 RepID=A0A915P7H2_9BILA